MPILFSISVLALVALLWAAFSAAQHIRRARRRKRRNSTPEALASVPGRMGLQLPTPAAKLEVSFEELTPYAEAVISRPVTVPPAAPHCEPEPQPRAPMVVPEPPYVAAPAYVPRLTYARVSPFVSVGATPVPAQTLQHAAVPCGVDPVPAPEFAPGLFSAARPRAEEGHREESVTPPAAAPAVQPVAVTPALEEVRAQESTAGSSAPIKPGSGLRAVSGRHSVAALAAKLERSDWAYFNKDMGDLTDPYETPRTRPRIVSGDSRR